MSFSDYERIRDSFHAELGLMGDSDSFELILSKARSNSGIRSFRLSPIQREALLEFYNQRRLEIWKEIAERRQKQST